MAQTVITKIILRNDTSENWTNVNPVLSKGEIGVSIDMGKVKIGNGTSQWVDLPYANVLPSELGELGAGDMVKSVYDTNDNGRVDRADMADRLTTSITIGGVEFDGSTNIALTKDNVGLENVDNTTDLNKPISTVTQTALDNITNNLGTASSKNVGVLAGNVVEVLSNGKIDPNLLPALAITNTFTTATTSEMIALESVQQGDICFVTGDSTYILAQSPSTNLDNWKPLTNGAGGVSSVNGQTGNVSITTSDVAEGTGLYYTNARANANFITHASTELTDGDTLIHTTDTLILNGGNA